jgi:DNA-3-methyladenine glycosylase II
MTDDLAAPCASPPDDERVRTARAWLAARDPALAHMDERAPPFAWRCAPGGFSGLVRLVTGQQVSTAAAAAIWGRVEAGLGTVTPEAVLARDAAALRALGLSAPKVRYVQAIATAHLAGDVDFTQLGALDDAAAIAVLCGLTGVGRWTAEIYLMFCEGRLDVFPAGDLALQEGVRMAEQVAARPSERELLARAQLWRPYRGVAAHLIWAYYGAVRNRRGAPLPGLDGPDLKRVETI